MSYYFEAAVVSTEHDPLFELLEDLPRSGPLAPIALEMHRLADRGFAVFGWREGENRPDADEEIEQLAGELSRAFGVAVAIHYDDQVGRHDAVLYRGGEAVRVFGEGDEVWVPYGEDGELVTDGPRYGSGSHPEDIECDCIWDGIDAALQAAGFDGWVTVSHLINAAFHKGDPGWSRPGVSLEQEAVVRRLRGEGVRVSAIARATGLSHPTIYRVLGGEGPAPAARGARRSREGGGGGRPAEPPGTAGG